MNWMERMIRTRKQTPEIGWGDFTVIPSRRPADKRDVLILRYTWQENSVVVIHNFSGEPVDLRFRLPSKSFGEAGKRQAVKVEAPKSKRAKMQSAAAQPDRYLTNVLSNDHSVADAHGRHTILLEPYGYRWFRVGGQDRGPGERSPLGG
jgi:maltose alpha-D-glucosyltransferase/alpha-amylase